MKHKGHLCKYYVWARAAPSVTRMWTETAFVLLECLMFNSFYAYFLRSHIEFGVGAHIPSKWIWTAFKEETNPWAPSRTQQRTRCVDGSAPPMRRGSFMSGGITLPRCWFQLGSGDWGGGLVVVVFYCLVDLPWPFASFFFLPLPRARLERGVCYAKLDNCALLVGWRRCGWQEDVTFTRSSDTPGLGCMAGPPEHQIPWFHFLILLKI